MSQLISSILVVLVLTGFTLLGSSRLAACIRAVGFQGLLLGLLAISMQGGQLSAAGVLLPLTTAVVKGLLLPWLLFRAMRAADTVREVEPLISYNLSVIAGTAVLALALWLVKKAAGTSSGEGGSLGSGRHCPSHRASARTAVPAMTDRL